MKKFNLFLIFFMTTSRLVLGQMDINAVNKPVELLIQLMKTLKTVIIPMLYRNFWQPFV